MTPIQHLNAHRASMQAIDPVILCHWQQFFNNNEVLKMSEFNDIKKEFEALKKRNAPPAEFEALLKRNAKHRAGLFEKLECAVKGKNNE